MWNDGYFTDDTYTYGYYRELNPIFQQFCLLANGYETVSLDSDSLHCELGFGQGVSVNIHAAAIPGAWIGTDFNPAHAAHAKILGKASEADVELLDCSFAEMLERPDIPMFDSISMHGVWSWISQENQQKVVQFVRRFLKPGGIFYNSYNCFPGWAQNHPLRELLAISGIYARTGTDSVTRVSNAIAFAEAVLQANSDYAENNAGITAMLKEIKGKDAHYIAHEYMNRDWNIMYFTEVAEVLGEAKLDYVCTATLLDALDDVENINMTKEARKFLRSIDHPLMREEIRDYYINRRFRKDIYVKGARRLSYPEQERRMLETRYCLLNAAPGALALTGYRQRVNFKQELLDPIYNWLQANRFQPRDFRNFIEENQELKINGDMLLGLLKSLVECGIIAPCRQEEAGGEQIRCYSLNRYLCRCALHDGKITYLASPVTGGGIGADRITMMFLHMLWEGKTNLAKEVWQVLRSQGQLLIKDGKTLEGEKENLTELRRRAKLFNEKELPILKALGIYIK